MKKIITISREFGAGGGAIGRAVAERLGFEYLDKAIILKAASEAGIDVESMYKFDETVPASFGFAQSMFDFYNKPLNETLFEAQSKVIKRYAEKGKCVIVGRNANSILKEFDDCLHVFICANDKARLQRMMQEYPDAGRDKMAEQLIKVDRKRKKYCTYYTDTVFGEAKYYDLCLNSSKIGIDKCVDIICDLAL